MYLTTNDRAAPDSSCSVIFVSGLNEEARRLTLKSSRLIQSMDPPPHRDNSTVTTSAAAPNSADTSYTSRLRTARCAYTVVVTLCICPPPPPDAAEALMNSPFCRSSAVPACMLRGLPSPPPPPSPETIAATAAYGFGMLARLGIHLGAATNFSAAHRSVSRLVGVMQSSVGKQTPYRRCMHVTTAIAL
jgi:hypothetical protein